MPVDVWQGEWISAIKGGILYVLAEWNRNIMWCEDTQNAARLGSHRIYMYIVGHKEWEGVTFIQ